jgi:hypothetical protein
MTAITVNASGDSTGARNRMLSNPIYFAFFP